MKRRFDFLEYFPHFLYVVNKNHLSFGLLLSTISILLGYVIGSFPTAYVLLKWKVFQDIRTVGSGNVGAMNAYEVTGSKLMGIAVMLIDMVKGITAVGLTMLVFGSDGMLMSLCGLGTIAGHNFPVWLKFKGGRGLATTAGIMIVLGWLLLASWCLLWTISYLVSRHLHAANIIATVLSPAIILLIPTEWVMITIPSFMNYNLYLSIVIASSILIFLRHLDAIKAMRNSIIQ